MAQLTRRKISDNLAVRITGDNKSDASLALRQAAAELIQTGRVKQADLLAKDIEKSLISQGIAVADVYSPNPLSQEARQQIIDYIKRAESTPEVVLRQHADPSLLGGIRLEVAGKELDITLQRKLTALKAQKI